MIKGVALNLPEEYRQDINPVVWEELSRGSMPLIKATESVVDEIKPESNTNVPVEANNALQEEYKPTYWQPKALRKKYSATYSSDDEKQRAEALKAKLIAKGYNSSDVNYMLEMARKESGYGKVTSTPHSRKAKAQGIWQFTPGTLKTFGYDPSHILTEDEQIDLIGKYVASAKRKAAPLVTPERTIYSIIGGMHLGGEQGGYNYFTKGNNPNDGITSISDYVKHFGQFDF